MMIIGIDNNSITFFYRYQSIEKNSNNRNDNENYNHSIHYNKDNNKK